MALPDDLEAEHLAWATGVARSVAMEISGSALVPWFEDAVQEGLIGFMEACRRFDPERGEATLHTFAGHRIRGAVYDYARSNDYLTRAERKIVRDGEAEGRDRHFRETPDGDRVEIIARPPATLDAHPEKGLGWSDKLAAPDIDMDVSMDAEVALAALSPRRRRIVYLHYWKGLSLKAIGQLEGVTESRICQILGDAHADAEKALTKPKLSKSTRAQRVALGGPEQPKKWPRASVLLTNRELQVIRLVAAGASNREIGQQLWLGEETVKSHVKHILRVLPAKTRAHAAAIAVRRGIIQ